MFYNDLELSKSQIFLICAIHGCQYIKQISAVCPHKLWGGHCWQIYLHARNFRNESKFCDCYVLRLFAVWYYVHVESVPVKVFAFFLVRLIFSAFFIFSGFTFLDLKSRFLQHLQNSTSWSVDFGLTGVDVVHVIKIFWWTSQLYFNDLSQLFTNQRL